MFAFLLVIHALIAATLVTVILMQKSEGGGLGMGGSPSGLMSARGAADFLSRATAVLATVFVIFSIVLAVYSSTRGAPTIDTSLAHVPSASRDAVPNTPADVAASRASADAPTIGNAIAPADNGAVPLQR